MGNQKVSCAPLPLAIPTVFQLRGRTRTWLYAQQARFALSPRLPALRGFRSCVLHSCRASAELQPFPATTANFNAISQKIMSEKYPRFPPCPAKIFCCQELVHPRYTETSLRVPDGSYQVLLRSDFYYPLDAVLFYPSTRNASEKNRSQNLTAS